ncbi:MAG: heme-binding protein [Erythrobacter sp.]
MGIARLVFAGIGVAAIGAFAYTRYRDTEEPDYDVLFREDKFELRQYAPMIVAETSHTGDRRRAQSASFRRLASYIFAEDRPEGGEKIDMTAPVLQAPAKPRGDDGEPSPMLQDQTRNGEWRMSFVMPSRYTLATLPEPPADIELREVPGRRVASVRFSGVARESDLLLMEARLSEWIAAQGYTAVGGYEYGFYDAPTVPGPLRRNEVMIEVERP